MWQAVQVSWPEGCGMSAVCGMFPTARCLKVRGMFPNAWPEGMWYVVLGA